MAECDFRKCSSDTVCAKNGKASKVDAAEIKIACCRDVKIVKNDSLLNS